MSPSISFGAFNLLQEPNRGRTTHAVRPKRWQSQSRWELWWTASAAAAMTSSVGRWRPSPARLRRCLSAASPSSTPTFLYAVSRTTDSIQRLFTDITTSDGQSDRERSMTRRLRYRADSVSPERCVTASPGCPALRNECGGQIDRTACTQLWHTTKMILMDVL